MIKFDSLPVGTRFKLQSSSAQYIKIKPFGHNSPVYFDGKYQTLPANCIEEFPDDSNLGFFCYVDGSNQLQIKEIIE